MGSAAQTRQWGGKLARNVGNFVWAATMHVAMSPFTPTKLIRRTLMKMLGVNIPNSSYVAAGTIIGSDKIEIGERVGVNIGCHLGSGSVICSRSAVVP